MRHYKTEGVIIKRTNIGEGDRLLTVITKTHGKLTMIAKGVRKISSRRGPTVELFNHARLLVYKGKVWDILTEVELIDGFSRLKGDLTRIKAAYQICESVDILTRDKQENGAIFDLTVAYFHAINSGVNWQMATFKKQLLTMLGFLSEYHILHTDLDSYIEELAERRLRTKVAYE